MDFIFQLHVYVDFIFRHHGFPSSANNQVKFSSYVQRMEFFLSRFDDIYFVTLPSRIIVFDRPNRGGIAVLWTQYMIIIM